MAEPRRISQEKISPEIAGKLGISDIYQHKDRNHYFLEEWSDGTTRLRHNILDDNCFKLVDQGLFVLNNEEVKFIKTEQEKQKAAEAALPKV